ncbi:MAG TPA: rhomboid family intramembrane serine protease [Acidobacteriota bacterium]|nr:rhomboid family intramembrane serine protease [Acidobacteriota bacterium]
MASRQIEDALGLVLRLLAVIWVVELVNWLLLDHRLASLGIIPRQARGLIGVVAAPLLHASPEHALANSLPLLLLGGLVALNGRKVFLTATVTIVLLGGAGVWLLARDAVHIGASGLIFGYFGFLLARGWLDRSLFSLLLALAAIVLYGGMIWGLTPIAAGPEVSWEAHLGGFLAGIVASAWARRGP